ncbi:hypothetical protein [Pseudooceanicola sp. MF1-13]|uniref:hypothetical protein n=1 Tax=Pseudooceanicola sp. MF1-13 TaxID=3379095 RepID=UPI0038926498
MHLLKIALIASALGLTGQDATAAGTYQPPRVPANVQATGTQWITTQDGCSYSRTQAPGYPVQWVLILNPHHIGQPDSHDKCAPVLGG